MKLRALLLVTLFLLIPAQVWGIDLLQSRSDWFSTGADNSLQKVRRLHRFRRFRGETVLQTNSEETNIHAHYRRRGNAIYRGMTYTGKMMIADSDGGIGITFHSRYRKRDAYYRLRRYAGGYGGAFHIAPHGTSITDGDDDTGVVPVAGRWYRFRIRVLNRRRRVRILAKVWRAGRRQPRGWQVDCSDDSGTRIRRGKVGVWSMADGVKRWGDLEAVSG